MTENGKTFARNLGVETKKAGNGTCEKPKNGSRMIHRTNITTLHSSTVLTSLIPIPEIVENYLTMSMAKLTTKQ